MPAMASKVKITKDGYRAEDTADARKRTGDFLAQR